MRISVLMVIASVVAFVGGYVGAPKALATYDTWYVTSNYWRTDPYGTDFYAATGMYYDSATNYWGPGVNVGTTWLRMDVIYNSASEYLNCDADAISGEAQSSGWKNWFNSPFPLDYYNTPAWDYFTWDGTYNFFMSQEFGASRDEQCNTNGHVPPGAEFWHDHTGGFYESAW